MRKIDKYIIHRDSSIREVVNKIDESGKGFIVLVDGDTKAVGVITDGDFRRAVLNGISMSEDAIEIATKDFEYLNENHDYEEVFDLIKNKSIKRIPILDSQKRIIDLIFSEDIIEIKKQSKKFAKLENQVVIMAGGKGTRLTPFTHILPKPLIPIGEKAILELIIENFTKHNMEDFFVSIGYKGNMIKAFMENLEKKINIDYVIERKPLGTAGALSFLRDSLNDTFFLTNCDIIIRGDYSKIMDFHREHKFDLTMVASMLHHKIPYGVLRIDNNGLLLDIDEKPSQDILVNTGFYILEPSCLDLIPDDKFFHITDLMEIMRQKGLKIGVFPISEKKWIDIGQWEEYQKAVSLLTPR